MKRNFLIPGLALLALSSLADPWDDERKTFLQKYRSDVPADRNAAVRALQQHRNADGIDLLVKLYLQETDKDVQQAFVEVLGGVIDGEGRKRFYEHCRGLHGAETRAKLVAILGRGGFRDTMETVRDLSRDTEPLVRAAAIEAIRAAKWHNMEPVARTGLGDAEPLVRVAACRVLGEFRSDDSVDALIKVVEFDLSEEVKAAAGEALGGISGQKYGTEAAAWKTWREGRVGLRVSPAEVDRALDRAGQWLVKLHPNGFAGTEESHELELYALIHAGVPLDNPVVKSGIDALYKKPMARVYNVSLGAMALCDISPSLHQPWLAEAAEFIVNWQCDNGQFTYGEALPGKTPTLAPPVSSGTRPEMGGGTKATKRVVIRRNPKRKTSKFGDNSNTQYAVLGLRACAEAGVDVPKEVWLDCLGYLKISQTPEGGFGYNVQWPGVHGSIHTSALGAYIVCRYYGGFGTKHDGVVDKGLEWLAANFAVSENPKRASAREWLYYYLYGMERVGVLANTEFFGKREWYQEGARYLLQQQAAGGDWNNDAKDTAWAVLFLRRATRPVGKVEDK